MAGKIRIGTRDSELALWQASHVKSLLASAGADSELVYIKSEGDLDLKTPLYEMGVQGIFTRSLDIALLNDRIDLAVHSMKDVPTLLPVGLRQAAVLKRGVYDDLLVLKSDFVPEDLVRHYHIATSSIRRIAQWLHRYPNTTMHNLRGNVNTRLQKLQAEAWDAAIFARAGLERIDKRPARSLVLDWMLPAPSQGAIMVMCRQGDDRIFETCKALNDPDTALCTGIEKDFLRVLMGGCATPIGALAEVQNGQVFFRGNILSVDGRRKAAIEKWAPRDAAEGMGSNLALQLLEEGGREILQEIRHAR